jgi:hypothetical protein
LSRTNEAYVVAEACEEIFLKVRRDCVEIASRSRRDRVEIASRLRRDGLSDGLSDDH